MSIHKIKPKLKKYKKAGLLKARKNSAKQVRFFLPECTYLNSYLKKLENSYSDSLINRRKIKLLSGFYQVNKLSEISSKPLNDLKYLYEILVFEFIKTKLANLGTNTTSNSTSSASNVIDVDAVE